MYEMFNQCQLIRLDLHLKELWFHFKAIVKSLKKIVQSWMNFDINLKHLSNQHLKELLVSIQSICRTNIWKNFGIISKYVSDSTPKRTLISLQNTCQINNCQSTTVRSQACIFDVYQVSIIYLVGLPKLCCQLYDYWKYSINSNVLKFNCDWDDCKNCKTIICPNLVLNIHSLICQDFVTSIMLKINYL